MTDYLPRLRDIFVRFSPPALALGISLVFLLLAAPAEAQTTTAADNAVATADSKADLKTSLNQLLTLRQSEVQKLEKRQEQSKVLYNDGLISRVELENGEEALADARTKVDDINKQIAAANQLAPVIPAGLTSDLVASNTNWSTGNSRIDTLIRYYAAQHGVDPYLIFCLMSQESKFSANATSYKGAMGLMQLMPGTAARYGVTNPYDVAQSIMGGTRYLKDLLKMFNGRVDLALAGYNAGEGAVMKYGYTIPPYSETRNYVKLILQRYIKKQSS